MLLLHTFPKLLEAAAVPKACIARLARYMSHCSLSHVDEHWRIFLSSSDVLGSCGPTAHVLSEMCMESNETEGDVSSSSGLSFTSLP